MTRSSFGQPHRLPMRIPVLVSGMPAPTAMEPFLSASQLLHTHSHTNCTIAVGTPIAGRPPHRTERARFRHSAPTLGD
jgi:hypothetical protein